MESENIDFYIVGNKIKTVMTHAALDVKKIYFLERSDKIDSSNSVEADIVTVNGLIKEYDNDNS